MSDTMASVSTEIGSDVAMEKELAWLLQHSIPDSIGHIKRHLSQIPLLAVPPASKASAIKNGLQVQLHEKKTGDVCGTGVVAGAMVTQLSLSVAALGQLSQGRPAEFHLKKNETIALRQMQDAQSYAYSAMQKTQNMSGVDTREEALQFIMDLRKDIQGARQIFISGKHRYLMPLQAGYSEKFVPALPENIVVEPSIEGCEFNVCICLLSFRRSAKSTGGFLDSFKRDHSGGHMLIHNDRLAEVKREVIMRAPLQDASKTLECLESALGICNDIVGQLHAFDSMM